MVALHVLWLCGRILDSRSGADARCNGACIGLDEAHGTDLSPNSFEDMMGRYWCQQGEKMSQYDANA